MFLSLQAPTGIKYLLILLLLNFTTTILIDCENDCSLQTAYFFVFHHGRGHQNVETTIYNFSNLLKVNTTLYSSLVFTSSGSTFHSETD